MRKRDTGEIGNQGDFGTIPRSDADIAVINESERVRRESNDEESGPSQRITIWTVQRAEQKSDLASCRLDREGITERFQLERVDEQITHRAPSRSRSTGRLRLSGPLSMATG